MKRILTISMLGAICLAVLGAGYTTLIYTEQGGAKRVFASGAELELQDGATIDIQTPLLFTPRSTGGATTEGLVYYDSDSDTLNYYSSGASLVALGSGTGDNTLDLAYDQGGAGAGAKIDADSGAVEIEVDDASNNVALHLDCDDATNGPTALLIENAADAANAITIDIDAQATGRDVEGTGASWYVSGAGAGTFASLSVTGASNALVFEGATANDFETSIAPADPTTTNTVTLADASGTVMLSALATNAPDAANAVTGASNALVFEGATANDFETSIVPTDATADQTITLPDASGMVWLTTWTVTADADGKTVAAAEAGDLQTNAGAVGGGVWNLPEASTVIGKPFLFAVAASQNLDINPDDADQILALTNAAGNAIRNATPGNTICLVAVDATNWVAVGPYGTWSDVD